MNRIIGEQYGLFRLYQRLRDQLLASLTDTDLAFTPGSLESSVAGLRAWYEQLDAELYAAVAALSDEDVASRRIDRGHGFMVPADVQLHIYQEALIIFYGKATVYLKLLDKPTSEQWQHWIG